MIHKLIQWFKQNVCIECDYYCSENNVCQSKKCATCGRNPYVDWFDRHFCEAHKTQMEGKNNGTHDNP